MRKFLAGLIVGIIVASVSVGIAASEIRLIVNGKEVQSDVPAQIINGRTMIPARALAEALGATVKWDDETRSVVVEGKDYIPPSTDEWQSLRDVAIQQKWKAGGEPFTITNLAGRTIIYLDTSPGEKTGRTAAGCSVRALFASSPSANQINVPDLQRCDFIRATP